MTDGHHAKYPDTKRGGHLFIRFPPIGDLEQLDRSLAYYDERVKSFREVLERQIRREIARTAETKRDAERPKEGEEDEI